MELYEALRWFMDSLCATKYHLNDEIVILLIKKFVGKELWIDWSKKIENFSSCLPHRSLKFCSYPFNRKGGVWYLQYTLIVKFSLNKIAKIRNQKLENEAT